MKNGNPLKKHRGIYEDFPYCRLPLRPSAIQMFDDLNSVTTIWAAVIFSTNKYKKLELPTEVQLCFVLLVLRTKSLLF